MKLSIDPTTLSLLTRLSEFLANRGIRSYLTGGFIRDALLGRETADVDIALAADALEIAPELAASLGSKCFPLDETNRVGRIVVGSRGANSAGGQRVVDLSTLKGDIKYDLGQRDFEIF